MTRTTTRRLVAVAAMAALVVAGCGQGDDESGETVEVVRDLDLLEGVEAAGTARMSWDADVEAPSSALFASDDPAMSATARLVQSAEGVVDLETGASEWTATMRSEVTFPEGAVDEPVAVPETRFEVRVTPEGEWFRMWSEGEAEPGWVSDDSMDVDEGTVAEEDHESDESDESDEGVSGLALGDPTAFSPTEFFETLREEADSVTVVGEEEVRGDSTTRYRAVVDREALDSGGDLWPAEPEGTVSVDVWIDGEDRLRKVEAGGLVVELWDFGIPVEVEAPTDVVDEDTLEGFFDTWPRVDGEWALASSGSVGDAPWEVWAAPATGAGTETTCRTLEVSGNDLPDILDGFTAGLGEELAFPTHGGLPAVCGSGTFTLSTGTFVADPALQVLASTPSMGGEVVPLGFVVRSDLAADGVRLVLADADPVDLALDDAGIAVWAAPDGARLTAVELEGGAVRCEVPRLPGGDDEDDVDAGDALDGVLGALALGTGPCVRV